MCRQIAYIVAGYIMSFVMTVHPMTFQLLRQLLLLRLMLLMMMTSQGDTVQVVRQCTSLFSVSICYSTLAIPTFRGL